MLYSCSLTDYHCTTELMKCPTLYLTGLNLMILLYKLNVTHRSDTACRRYERFFARPDASINATFGF